MTLYHCSPSWLEPESVIRPGNYGRILKLIGPSHSHWLREQFLEFVRIQEFPDKPSRLTCAFTCENLDAARFFKEHHCNTGIVYEVELVNLDANLHTTDFNCVQPIPGKLENMWDVARHYWCASHWFEIEGRPDLQCAETLVESGLRVVKEIK